VLARSATKLRKPPPGAAEKAEEALARRRSGSRVEVRARIEEVKAHAERVLGRYNSVAAGDDSTPLRSEIKL